MRGGSFRHTKKEVKTFNIPKVIYIYNEGIEGVDFKKLKDFIYRTFGKIRVSFVELKEKVVETRGLLFNFVTTQNSFGRLKHSKTQDACHIILTSKLFVTYDEQKKLHIRAVILGFPSVISTSGIVEGPAKPKEYYLYKQKYTQLGVWGIEEARIKQKFKQRFIDYHDKRLTKVLKGYLAQALFFYLTGEPFCKQKNCRLFNSHWQEDLIYSQIKIGKFCPKHKKLLEQIKSP